MSRSRNNPWLNRFAVFTALSTLFLISVGGLVTSHGVGMAVPDWPTTYGYNMFLFPPSQWIGGIFYEHTHRLVASFVGLLTTVLAVWLWLKEERRWLRWLGVAAFVGVAFQGVLGGLRVTLYKDEIGIFHAAIAQLFLVLVSCIALFTSQWWQRAAAANLRWHVPSFVRVLFVVATLFVLLQLILGAMMRHQHAGLAVPDFPLAYGQIWPPMDQAFIERVNSARIDVRDFKPITAFQIGLHMAHRIGALATLILVGFCAWASRRVLGGKSGLTKMAMAWFCLILVQAGFGVATVLSVKAADIATGHVVLGAASLVLGSLLSVALIHFSIIKQPSRSARQAIRRPGDRGSSSEGEPAISPV